jgi:hypothetical protein
MPWNSRTRFSFLLTIHGPAFNRLTRRPDPILENALRLQGMTEAEAIEVVLGPGSHLVSEQVATEIVRFAGGADQRAQDRFTVEPVLLSVVLYGLNQRRQESHQAAITSDLLSGEPGADSRRVL